MARSTDKKAPNGLVRFLRKLYNPLGFNKGYNALLWFILDGAFLGFLLAKASFLNINGMFCGAKTQNSAVLHASPGECYYYEGFSRYHVGISIHLYCIFPAGFLAIFQFIPIIRYKALLWHRMAGYVIIVLVLVSNAGGLMIADRAFGGSPSTQALIGMFALLSTGGLSIALYNIKKLQIDQHRAWMLRTWVYTCTIISLRIIQALAATIVSYWQYEMPHVSMPCDELLNIYANNSTKLYSTYPACDPTNPVHNSTNNFVSVLGNFRSDDPTQLAAGLHAYFGMAGWLALALHAFGVELYLHLTPAESDRLRQVSYEKQLEKGWKNAGYSGLVVERIGDANPWEPEDKGAAGNVKFEPLLGNSSSPEPTPLKDTAHQLE